MATECPWGEWIDDSPVFVVPPPPQKRPKGIFLTTYTQGCKSPVGVDFINGAVSNAFEMNANRLPGYKV